MSIRISGDKSAGRFRVSGYPNPGRLILGSHIPEPVSVWAPTWTILQWTDGSVTDLGGGTWQFVGPNSGGGDSSWFLIKAQAPSAGTLPSITYSWSTTDVGGLIRDWPFYYVGASEPFANNPDPAIRGYSPGNIVASSPETGALPSISYSSGDWVAFGIFSSNDKNGAGTIDFTGLPGTLPP